MPLPLTADDGWFAMAEAMDELVFREDEPEGVLCAYCDGDLQDEGFCKACQEWALP